MQFNEFLKKECVDEKCTIEKFVEFNNLQQSDVIKESYTYDVSTLCEQRLTDNYTMFNKASPLIQAAVLFAEAKLSDTLWNNIEEYEIWLK